MKRTNKNDSCSSLKIDDIVLLRQESSKYLVVILDSKICFLSHILKLRLMLGRQCGTVAKARHDVPEEVLIRS